jgi:tRNA (guanine37-N1)-methyltransferase
MNALYLKVQKAKGENVRRLLIELKLLATDLKITPDDDFLLIPLTRRPLNEEEFEKIRKQVCALELGTGTFHTKAKSVTMLELLEDKLPPHVLACMPKSVDIVGHIAIVEITPELEPYKALLGQAILTVNRNVRTVLAKASPISTQYRIREFETLAGEDRTETVHNEYGCKYLLDVRKVYFSPRLGYEHDRVSRLVNEGETVIDMFSGIGPFSILIAKRRSLVKVYAIDVNPEAIRYLEENVRLNKVTGKVIPLLGDCGNIVHMKLRGVADRVIMNLPAQSLEFVDLACEAIKPAGGIMHLYTFSDKTVPFERLRHKVEGLIGTAGRSVKGTLGVRIVKAIAPYRLQVAVDAGVV